MSSMLDQLLEGADRFLEETVDKDQTDIEEACGKGSCGSGTCGKGSCKEGSGMDFSDITKNADTNPGSDNPDKNTVGPNVHEGAEENMDGMNLSESEMLTADELFNCYSEAVVEVLRESKKAITQKYTEKKNLAKKFKAKKLAEKSKSAKKQKLEEAAMDGNFNTVMEQILDAR